MTSTVATPTACVMEAEEKRRLPRALMRGTVGMRAAGKEYLPQEMAESEKAYEIRLRRSFLFNGYGKTVRDMAGKVFTRPIALGDDVPDAIKAYAENIDLTGRNLDVFAHAVFVDALAEGISYILTDMSAAPVDADGNPRMLTMAESAGRRPWAVHIKAAQVLGWRSEDIGGVEVLTQFRFMERITEEDGDFGERQVEQVRAFIRDGDAVRWETHRKAPGTDIWSLHESGTVTIGQIAVAPVYVARTGFMMGTPPLADLAEVNLAHWQSQSDQRNILHVARVPILFGSGIPETAGPLEIGASRMVRVSDPNASLAYVEHNGNAITAGRDDLKDLEFQMQTMGLELIIPRPGGQTATGAAIDQARMNAPLAMMANALKDAMEQTFGFMALYAGLGNDAGGSLTVNTDFGAGFNGASDGQLLISAAKEGIISKATAIREMKRRGVLSDEIDPETEVMAALDESYNLTDSN